MQNACCWALLILSFGNSLLPKSHACPTWDFALVLAVRRRCCSMLFLCGRSAGNLNFVQDNGDDKDGAKSKDSSSRTGTRIHRFVVNQCTCSRCIQDDSKAEDGAPGRWLVGMAGDCRTQLFPMSKHGKLFLVDSDWSWSMAPRGKPFLLTRFARFVQDHRAISRYI